MNTLMEVVSSERPRTGRRGSFRRSISWRALPLLVVVSLLASLAGIGAPALAADQHQGEETAQFLPNDVELYLTVNLAPSEDQMTKMLGLLNYWWQNPNVKAKWAEFLAESEEENGIDIEDIFTWLGPEMGIAVRGLTNASVEDPDAIWFIGTTDKAASDDFVFGELLPFLADEAGLPAVPTKDDLTSYRGVDTLYAFLGTGTYWAFTDRYILVSVARDADLLESCLDLIVDAGLSGSLADDADFQQAQAALPADRVGMVYLNLGEIWQNSLEIVPPEGEQDGLGGLVEMLGGYVPPYLAASLCVTGSGISVTATSPLPEGVTLPSTEPASLKSAGIVPEGTLLYASWQDVNAYWQQVRSIISDNWEATPEAPTFDDALNMLATELGVDIDNDVFGWMTGEFSFALLPVDFGEGMQPQTLDVLIMFEVDEPSAVEAHLNTIIGALNTIIESEAEGEPDLLETSPTTVGGVDATLVSNDGIAADGASPGWLFLDVDGTDYLVIGSTTAALEAAVAASQGSVPSLDEAEQFEGVLGLLPEDSLGIVYLNLTDALEAAVASAPTAEMTEDELADFEFLCSIIPLRFALGFAFSATDTDVQVTGAAYLMPPPLVEQEVAEGSGKVEIEDQLLDFSDLDAQIGLCAVGMNVDVTDAPAGAKIQITGLKNAPEEVQAAFESAAAEAGLTILEVAYVVRVDGTNLSSNNLENAVVTLKVGRDWADEYGVKNIRVFRVSDDTAQVLITNFVGYQGDNAVFEGISAGFSYFGLVAVQSAGMNWALIGGIVGGLLLAALVVVLLRRARATAA